MSYYTEVCIDYYSDDGSVTPEMLLAEARVYLSGFDHYAVDDVMEVLTTGFNSGTTSIKDLNSSDLTDLFRALSKKHPKVRLDIWGHGEEFGDVWARRFLGGKVSSSAGRLPTPATPEFGPRRRTSRCSRRPPCRLLGLQAHSGGGRC